MDIGISNNRIVLMRYIFLIFNQWFQQINSPFPILIMNKINSYLVKDIKDIYNNGKIYYRYKDSFLKNILEGIPSKIFLEELEYQFEQD